MTVSFYRAPYLVDIDVVQGKRVLMLDDISENAEAWRDADVLSFNSGHWWTHTGSMQGYAALQIYLSVIIPPACSCRFIVNLL